MKSRGVCAGRPLRREDISSKSESLFWAKVQKGDDHWLWTACRSNGIPFFSVGGRSWTARRVVWALTHGEAPAGVPIGACVEPLCVNPEHLGLKTAKELAVRRVRAGVGCWDAAFVADMRSRYQSGESPVRLTDAAGVPYDRLYRMLRNKTYPDDSYAPPSRRAPRGEEQHSAKFAWATVREARRLFAEGTSVYALARRYGCAQSTTWDMLHGVTWSDPDYVPPPVVNDPVLRSAKLTWDQVREARHLFTEGSRVTDLSKRYGVSQQAMSAVVSGRTWVDAAR